ncbi:MAG: hypothetical protein LBC70_04245 [Chitinispirillales bacterium]|nr:hypothetical protein [Chitinispirillales bacterium]
MKKIKLIGLFCVLAVCFGFGAAFAQTGERYCEISLSGCPQDYDGDTLVVPLDVIAISTRIQACGIVDSVTGEGGGTPPAVVFVIDHSMSMTSGSNAHDANGNRFRITQALIDSIYAEYPQAEIGFVLFGAGLTLLDTSANSGAGRRSIRDPNLMRFGGMTDTDAGNNQAYLPLMALNEPVLVNERGYLPANTANPTAIDLYRSMFHIPTTGRAGVRQDTTGTSLVGEQGGTNISIAFEAALEAFTRTSIPRENQYIIFLSDGEPTPDGSSSGSGAAGATCATARCLMQYDFVRGTNTPTTYTVFLNRIGTRDQLPSVLDTVSSIPWGSQLVTGGMSNETVDNTLYRLLGMTAPQTVGGMTYNIRNNGYSATNLLSNVWVMQSDFNEILDMMMENIITPMLSTTEGEAKTIVISSAGVSDSTGAMNGNFTFSRRLPIDTSDITVVSMGIRYDVRIYTDTTIGGRDTTITRLVPDSLFTYSFAVRRSNNASTDWQVSQSLSSLCGDKPRLDLQHRGTSLIGGEVRGNMDTLTVRFDNTGGLFSYDTVRVQVMNADSTFTDIENFTLRRSGDIWTVNFVRVVDTTARADGRLQHAAMDSIIVVFRNPYIPLDTLRLSVPFVSNNMAFYDSPGNPANGTELPNNLIVIAGDSTNIFAKIFDADGIWTPELESDPARFTWTVSDQANASLTATGVHGIFYSETADRTYNVTATYTDPFMTISRTVAITVRPASPHYLQVVFDSTNVLGKADTNMLKASKEFEFERDVDRTIFYAVERDRFGNFISFADGSNWNSTNTGSITTDPRGDASSAQIARHGFIFHDDLRVIIEKNGMVDTVYIKVVGISSTAISPNPFVPGVSDVEETLRQLGALDFYQDIVTNSIANHGSRTGVLIAATAARTIQVNSNGTPKAQVIIYDAVGGIVYRSKPGDLTIAADGNTVGFTWDGKNMAGRTIGPGTYLVRIVATQTNNERFSSQRMIGVTTER